MRGRTKSSEQPLLPSTDSPLKSTCASWSTSPSYQSSLRSSTTAFHSVTDALLENPNLNSTYLFRADIVFDSTGILKTNKEKEDFCSILPFNLHAHCETDGLSINTEEPRPPLPFAGFELRRTVVRRLIPRKPQLDQSLLQTCHIYTTQDGALSKPDEAVSNITNDESQFAQLALNEKLNNKLLYKRSIVRHLQHLVVYQPHTDPLTGSDMPWYHPPLKYLAFLYTCNPTSDSEMEKQEGGTLSVHFQCFQGNSRAEGPLSITDRVHRTLLSLSSTYTRLARNTPVCSDGSDGEEKAMPISATRHIKDNIIPEHLVQNTYSRLKTLYASDLIKRWVEKTDPSKHVFEDLSIAAFLLELWRKMYGSKPSDFPGFVDIACGNGVLVYVLIMEGFRGFGFDARVRRTWSLFPALVTAHLQETVCIPRPFLEALQSQGHPLQEDLSVHDGIFEAGTFIISNHADELTTWTPLLAALSHPESPLPWLAIPCCSHALSGAAHRYQSFPHQLSGAHAGRDLENPHHRNVARLDCDEQPKAGDLTALRASKKQSRVCSQERQSGRPDSTYASLVNQVTSLAKKADPVGDVQQTLMRIPSTRNIGILGGQLRGLHFQKAGGGKLVNDTSSTKQLKEMKLADLTRGIYDVVEEECERSGGVEEAAKIWMEGVQKALGATRYPFKSV